MWELIPFSFVIDWVSNAQEHVNQMTRISLGSPYTEFTRLMYSVLERTICARYVQTPTFQDSYWTVLGPDSPTLVAKFEQRVYRRTFSYPAPTPHLDFSGIGKGKLLSLGELAIQFFK
jgi:hypothetical protein